MHEHLHFCKVTLHPFIKRGLIKFILYHAHAIHPFVIILTKEQGVKHIAAFLKLIFSSVLISCQQA